MTVNFELLDAAIEDAANGRDGIVHNQGDWISPADDTGSDANHPCGTAVCLAGFIGLRAGATMPKPQFVKLDEDDDGDGFWEFPWWSVNPDTGRYEDGPESVEISVFARDRAGLSRSQANAMFYGGNSLENIRAMRDYLRDHADAKFDELIRVGYPDVWGRTDA